MSNETKQSRDGLTRDGNMITILLADDDPDDRQLTRDAFKENRLANSLATVEDGEELLEYLPQHAAQRRPRTAEGNQSASGVPPDSHCRPHHVQGGRRYSSHLRPGREFVY